MSRIEEIKEKVNSWEDEPCLTTEEANYLLSRLELYENAIFSLLVRSNGLIREFKKITRISDDSITLTKNISDEIIEKCELEKIKESLQQIRS